MPRTAIRREIHSEDIPITQKPAIENIDDYDGDIIIPDKETMRALKKDYADALSFNEEPVVIRLEPSAEKHAATTFPVWVNGKGCELLVNDRWVEYTYIPVGQQVTTKRKYVEVIVRAKRDAINTKVLEPDSERPRNLVDRFTSAASAFSVIHDANPKGAVWLTELRQRMG